MDLVARFQDRLVDPLAVDRRSARGAEVDELDLARPRDLDDRVHARHRLVVKPQVRGRQLADLDDRLVQDLRLAPADPL